MSDDELETLHREADAAMLSKPKRHAFRLVDIEGRELPANRTIHIQRGEMT
jgi:hypothetical protein